MKVPVFAFSLVLLLAGTVLAGEPVSHATLEGMGLGQMQQLSDADGLAVRGKGPFDNLFFWNRIAFGTDGGSTGGGGGGGGGTTGPGGFTGPTLSNHFGDRFDFGGLGGSAGDSMPGGAMPGAGATTGFGGLSFDFLNF